MGKVKQVATVIKELDEQINALVSIKEDLQDILRVEVPETSETKAEVIISLEQVRGVLAEKSRDGLTKQVKALIQSFGANRLSEVKKSDYLALLNKAKELCHE
ncbi:rRNA biogenesis protein rrp5 [Aerococcaceae bacterium NML191219]|nr:rRNA biogenesis protein rrp5 [Aerococcaceae bacterium NML191219]